MSLFPFVFTFYSFKGGVGRSMAALNAGFTLASWGRRVLLVDMDLEAPGVSGFLERHQELDHRPARDILDLVEWAKTTALAHPAASEDEEAIIRIAPPLTDFCSPIKAEKLDVEPLRPRLGELGRLDVIGAHEERDYFNRLHRLGLWKLDREQLVQTSRTLRTYLRAQRSAVVVPDYYGPEAARPIPYDYILVDSRTGINETAGLCIGPLADRLVVLTALNDQNIVGTRQFLENAGVRQTREFEPWDEADLPPADQSAPPRLGPKPVLIVASPVPVGETEAKEGRLQQLRQFLGREAAKLSYHPRMALIETIFVRDYREEPLANQYLQLTTAMISAVNDSGPQLARAATWQESSTPEERLKKLLTILRLSPQMPDVAESLLQQHANAAAATSDAEFVAADRMFRILTQRGAGDRDIGFDMWGTMMSRWAAMTGGDLSRVRLRRALEIAEAGIVATDAKGDQQSFRLANRGRSKFRINDIDGAIADLSAAILVDGVTPLAKASALRSRAGAFLMKEDLEAEESDFRAIMELPGAPSLEKDLARLYLVFNKLGGPQREQGVAELQELGADRGASPTVRSAALTRLGVVFLDEGQNEAAVEQFARALSLPGIDVQERARALVNRASAYQALGRIADAVADCTAALDFPGVEATSRSGALRRRAAIRLNQGDNAGCIADAVASRVLRPAEDSVRVLLGLALARDGHLKSGMAELDLGLRAITEEGMLVTTLGHLRDIAAKHADDPDVSRTLALAQRRLSELTRSSKSPIGDKSSKRPAKPRAPRKRKAKK